MDFSIRTTQQYFFTFTHILCICYILYFESIVVFDRGIVEEKEFYKLFENNKEMSSQWRNRYFDRFLKEGTRKSTVELHVNFFTVELVKESVAG